MTNVICLFSRFFGDSTIEQNIGAENTTRRGWYHSGKYCNIGELEVTAPK